MKDLAAVLKDMEPWVKNPETLYSGDKPGNFALLPREILGNWLMCAVGNALDGTHNFASVWAVGLDRAENDNTYYYWVVQFENGHCPVVEVKIDFAKVAWLVSGIQ